ncbi:hypothetical protein ACFORH_42920 [Amycolatopsis roodepoortensis]|uniref:Uncharacterized protein n=1 Tax=Amycolatopsis roodepoortensis TaxID=700274 RepID=A0ABR9L3F9_9PSEU|nr:MULTISPECIES: hypothetical protein [Amycolatopsis]MBE1575075.1 hypothetical protein [Amycolatopsis roodepoortensis]GHG97515.1 hypothetical protein GCM10017788_77070 [Amycolatopsis acidiphila]
MTMPVEFHSSFPPIPAVIELGGLQVRQAGAVYVPVRGSDDHVHWAHQAKLRVRRVGLWCQESRFADAPQGAAGWASQELGFAPACAWCACLAPLPVRETDHVEGVVD